MTDLGHLRRQSVEGLSRRWIQGHTQRTHGCNAARVYLPPSRLSRGAGMLYSQRLTQQLSGGAIPPRNGLTNSSSSNVESAAHTRHAVLISG